ncbi:MAG: acriflavin resistance protein [Ruminococcus sp.]|uniref:Acriflavin resistance protein n=1 Tax=Schaedlerella arabinosiphila TaxID=2044587 RepID=A0A426DQ22_9FIRM|nr:efflux RND transporter permease subunit [Schaedlerella arabinosiphila]MCI8722510.1 acriflavin resistance protein [Ruminococcus sp.]RRK34885.1 acriflavin resistance protein [Schaedlerella arabinosiphila]
MLSKISVKKPYTVVVAVVLVLILGYVSFDKMTVDLLPDMNLPYAVVMTTYPGASPEEVEATVTRPVEQAMATISNIKNVSSSSMENASTVILEFEQTSNMDSVTIEMRESLDQIKGYWPDTVGNPMIMKLNPTMLPVMVPAVSVEGADPAETTRIIREEVQPELESLEGVASVNLFGDVEETIRVTIKKAKVSSVDASVQNQLDRKFKEAEDALADAKAQVEDGKNQLEAGAGAAAGQLSAAEQQIAQGDAELMQGRLEIKEKKSQLELARTTLQIAAAGLDASEQALNEQKQELEDFNSRRGEIEAEYQQVQKEIQDLLASMGQQGGDAGEQPPAGGGTDNPGSAGDGSGTPGAGENGTGIPETGGNGTGIPGAGGGGTGTQPNPNPGGTEVTLPDGTTITIPGGIPDNMLPGGIPDISIPDGTDLEKLAQLQLAQAALASQLALLDQYDSTMGVINEGLAQIGSNRQLISDKQAELDMGETMLNQAEAQLNAGTLTLAQARAQIGAAQLTAALEMSTVSAQLAVGETAIQAQEEELKKAKDTASAGADMEALLTGETVQTLLTAQNFNMPAGYVQEDGIDFLIRVGDKFSSIEELRNLVLVEREGINPIRLSDIADVERMDNADETYAKINGENGILFQIQKQTGYSTGDVTDRVLERLDQIQKKNKDIHTVVLMNQGVYIDMVVGSVLQNLVFGAVLAILILLVFLRDIRPTFVIACSIPISILTAIVLMYFSGVTMNVISLSGLALGVGMLVDNSIVVIENIYRMRNEEGVSAKKAAVMGAKEVAGAIAASTLTTVCVFLPIVFTEGIARQLFVDMGLTIAYSLLASLVVALSLVPMMSAGLLRKTQQKETRLFVAIQNGYERLLRIALKGKLVVLAGALALFIVSGVLLISRGTQFMPSMQSTEISMTVSTPEGTPLSETAQAADAFAAQIGELADVEDVGGMSGASGVMGGSSASNEVQFYALVSEDRSMSDSRLQKELEKAAQEQGLEINVSMSDMDMSALGSSGISVQIKGNELDTLRRIAGEVAEIVSNVKGTQNVSDGMEEVTRELRVVVDKAKAIAHNLTVAQIYQELAAKLRDQTSATSLEMDAATIDILVEEQKNQELTREDIKNLVLDVKKEDGSTEKLPLKDVAAFEDGEGLQAISRDAQSRYINVSAEVEEDDNVGLVSSRIQKELNRYQIPEGYTIQMTGEDETIRETMVELMKMLALAVVFMYLIMVAQFQSLRSPFIVMFTVPLAFTGGFLGLLVSGSLMSVIAMIGFVMLSGIIVNNGIVFIDYTNQLVAAGYGMTEALVEAGRTRLRPIVMTALTTILGLSTMALGVGSGSDMVQPMAVVTIGGLTYGTLLTLFVVPCIYGLFRKREKARLKEGMEEAFEDLEDFMEDVYEDE